MSRDVLAPLLLVAIVGLAVLRVVLRVRIARRAHRRPRPDHMNPMVPILFGVIVVGAYVVTLLTTPAAAIGALTAIAAGSLVAVLVGCWFDARDIRARSGDSWDVHRITVDGVVGIGCLILGVVGVVCLRVPAGQAHGLWWLSPVGTAAFLIVGNLIAWAWRHAHPDRGATAA